MAKAYIPKYKTTIIAEEGTGDNLLREDYEQGYVDYINITVLDRDGEEIDGGMLLLKDYFDDLYPKGSEDRLLKDAVSEVYGDVDYQLV